MAFQRVETALLSVGSLNELALRRSPVHSLDPRIKVLTTSAFLLTVVSFGKYDVLALLPLCLYPAALWALAGLPASALLGRLVAAAPFALLVGAFNPLLDKEVLWRVGSMEISGGWVSFASILLRFLLAVSAALLLIATTGMENLCAALVRLKAPRAFAVQLLLMHRYLFVLVDQAARMVRAHRMRSFGKGALRLKTFGSLLGHLLLRTLARAQALHFAMLSRGFRGEIRLQDRFRIHARDWIFLFAWCSYFLMARLVDLPLRLGSLWIGGAGS